MPLLLVDGYNVINAVPEYRRLARNSLEEARVKLVEDLIAFHALKGERIVVIFDAARAQNPRSQRQEIEGVEIVFTAHRESADAAIERLAFTSPESGTAVVTADYLSQRIVSGKGIRRMTPRELAAEIAEVRAEAQENLPERARLALEDRIDREVREALKRLLGRKT